MSARFFVTGTDTGVGKTEASVALLSLMAARGLRPFAFKPCESGAGDDRERLQRAGGGWQSPKTVCLYRFQAPLAPALAARAERRRIQWQRLLLGFKRLGEGAGVVEGAGGLCVPLDAKHDVIDLIEALKMPVVLVARAGLGTLNHTALSLGALASRKIPVAAVLLSQSSAKTDVSVATNRKELERRFPRLAFIGPVEFESQRGRRQTLFQKALAPVLC